MSSRKRDGTVAVTVTPSTAAPNSKVVVKATVTGTTLLGVLGGVFNGATATGVPTVSGSLKACSTDAKVVTHSALLSGTEVQWEVTLPADATGTLTARVVTLSGDSGAGSAQQFALGSATITVSGAAGPTTAPGPGGATPAAGTTQAAGTTTKAAADKTTAGAAALALSSLLGVVAAAALAL